MPRRGRERACSPSTTSQKMARITNLTGYIDDGGEYLLSWDSEKSRAIYIKREDTDIRQVSIPIFNISSPEISTTMTRTDEGASREQKLLKRTAVVSVSPKYPVLSSFGAVSPPPRLAAICGDYESDCDFEFSTPPTKDEISDGKENDFSRASKRGHGRLIEEPQDQGAEVNSTVKVNKIFRTTPNLVKKSVCRGPDSESEAETVKNHDIQSTRGRGRKPLQSTAFGANNSTPNSILVGSSRLSASTSLAAAATYFRELDRERLVVAPVSSTDPHLGRGISHGRTARVISLNDVDLAMEYEQHLRASERAGVLPLSSHEYAAGLGVHFGKKGCPDTLLDHYQK